MKANMEATRGDSPVSPKVPGYRLLREVGRGRFGSVWLAEALSTDGNVLRYTAIKLLRQDVFADHEMAAIRAFLNRLPRGHPNLVAVLQVGEAEGNIFYAMDLADGHGEAGTPLVPASYDPKTLQEEIRREGFQGLDRTLRILREVLQGLDHLHRHGLLHRDLKPANILFIKSVAALSDLGLVTSIKDIRSNAGTLLYSPPEGTRDASGDLYALGKVLYEMVTGTPPTRFPELPPGLGEEQLDAVRRLRPVSDRACHPDPSRRFRTAGEFLKALGSVQGVARGSWKRWTRWVALVVGILVVAGVLQCIPGTTDLQGSLDFGCLEWPDLVPISLPDRGLRTGDRFRIAFTLEPPSFPLLAVLFRNQGSQENVVQIQYPKDLRDQKALREVNYPLDPKLAIPLKSPPATVVVLALASRHALETEDRRRVEEVLKSLPGLPPIDRVSYLHPRSRGTTERGPGEEIPSPLPLFEALRRQLPKELLLVDAVAFPQVEQTKTE